MAMADLVCRSGAGGASCRLVASKPEVRQCGHVRHHAAVSHRSGGRTCINAPGVQ